MMQSNLHKIRCNLIAAFHDPRVDLPGPEREEAKITRELELAESFIKEAKSRLEEIKNA